MSTPHPSAEAVSELLEGLLSPDETAAVERHLAGCPDCSEVRDALTEVRDLLGDLPEPRLPDDVAARLDQVAMPATASPGSTEPGVDAATPPAAGSLDGARARRRRRLLAAAGAAAACAALLVGSGVVLQQLDGAADGGSGAATVAKDPRTPRHSAAEEAPGVAAGPTALAPLSGTAGYLTASGRDYANHSLRRGVTALVADDPRTATGPGRLEGGRLADRQALASCLAGLSPHPTRPLAVDLATYEGAHAAVVVLPVPGHPDRVDAWVVAPGCSARDPQVRDHLRVRRP